MVYIENMVLFIVLEPVLTAGFQEERAYKLKSFVEACRDGPIKGGRAFNPQNRRQNPGKCM
jgi:hypothetical protein